MPKQFSSRSNYLVSLALEKKSATAWGMYRADNQINPVCKTNPTHLLNSVSEILRPTVSTSSSVTETKLQDHGNDDIEFNVSTDLTNTMDFTSISDNLPSRDHLKMPEDFDSIEDANYECVNDNIDIAQTEEVENGEIFQEDTQPGPEPKRARTPKEKRENNWVKHPLLPGCNNTCQKKVHR